LVSDSHEGLKNSIGAVLTGVRIAATTGKAHPLRGEKVDRFCDILFASL
jgi:hypothetical protein